MAIWMVSNRLGSERTIKSYMDNSESVAYYPPGSYKPTHAGFTRLLLHAEDMTDSSLYNWTVTNSGTTTTSSPAKIGQSFDLNDGSSYFYLENTDNNEEWLPHNNEKWQFDAWIYNTDRTNNIFDATDDRQTMISFGATPNTGTPTITFGPNENGYMAFHCYTGVTTVTYNSVTNPVPLNTWTHVAVVLDYSVANNLRMYVDGTLVYEDAVSPDRPFSTSPDFRDMYFGTVGGIRWQGYMDEVRILTGDDVYTSNFAPVNVPYDFDTINTSSTDTKLLLHFDNQGTDSSTVAHNLIPFSTVRYDLPKFMGQTANFGWGTGYLIESTYQASRDMMANDYWQLDFWVYNTDRTSNTVNNSGSNSTIYCQAPPGGGAATDYTIGLDENGYPHLCIWTGSVNELHSGTIQVPLDEWHHLAFTSVNNTFRMFVDGVKCYEASHYAKTPQSTPLQLGTYNGTYFKGAIDELRVLSGSSDFGVWTADFTPPNNEYTVV